MKEQFVNYEQSLKLKELGFDEPCFGCYKPNGDFSFIESNILQNFQYLAKNSEWQDLVGAPLWQQSFDWFLVKYNLNAYISYSKSYDWQFIIDDIVLDDVIKEVLYFKTKEEAMLNCVDELIEIVEQQKK